MVRAVLLALAIVSCATTASAVSLTITPDESVYQIGEQITLSVFGDPMGRPTAGFEVDCSTMRSSQIT